MNRKFLDNITVGTIGFTIFVLISYFFSASGKSLFKILIIIIPYFIVWIIFEIVFYKKTGKTLIGIRKGNLFVDDLYKEPNIYWAIFLVLVYMVVFTVQFLFYYHIK